MERRIEELRTLRVLRSWPAQTATGATALVFETESETIAFEVGPQAIAVLLRQLQVLASTQSPAGGRSS